MVSLAPAMPGPDGREPCYRCSVRGVGSTQAHGLLPGGGSLPELCFGEGDQKRETDDPNPSPYLGTNAAFKSLWDLPWSGLPPPSCSPSKCKIPPSSVNDISTVMIFSLFVVCCQFLMLLQQQSGSCPGSRVLCL